MRTITGWAILLSAVSLAGCGIEKKDLNGVTVKCRDRKANVVATPARLSIAPSTVEVCRGNSLTLNFSGPLSNEQAHTIPDDASVSSWLDKKNMSPTTLVIEVPPPEDFPNPDANGYKYTLDVTGVGQLDPRIVVQ
jgi:hypothetical protein